MDRYLTVSLGHRRSLARVMHADSFMGRLTGLLGCNGLSSQEGLLISPCSQVHTCGMRFDIDVAFLDRHGRVLRVVAELKPWRVARAPGAAHVLELCAGSIERHGLRRGQTIAWTESNA